MNSQNSLRIHAPHQAQFAAPLNLRAVTTQHAAAAHLRAQVFRASAECDGQRLRMSLRSCIDPANPAWGLTLKTRYGMLDWYAPAAVWQTFSGIAPDSGPPHSRLALCQAALALFPASLRSVLGEPVASAIWHTEARTALASHPQLWLQLDCHLDELTLTSHLAADTRCWQMLLAAHWHATPAVPSTRLATLPFTIPVIAGELELTPAASRTLGCGDVLRLSHCRFEIDGSGWVDLPACRLAVYWQADRNHFMFSQLETRTTMQTDYDDDDEIDTYDQQDEFAATNHQDQDEDEHETKADWQDLDDTPPIGDADALHTHLPKLAEPPVSTLEQLPFRLKVVLGDFELSLQTLRTLAPGTVLELKQGLPPIVTLEVHGRCMGRGELVELNGALAVQLTSWLDTPSGLPS